MKKLSVVLSVSDDRVLPAHVMREICDLFPAEKDVRLEFVVVKQAPTSGLGLISGDSDFVVLFDACGGYSPRDVARVVAPLLEGRADMVLGNRFGRLSRRAVVVARERIGNSFLTWLANRLFRVSLGDSQTGLRAFRREALGLKAPALRFAEVSISHREGECAAPT